MRMDELVRTLMLDGFDTRCFCCPVMAECKEAVQMPEASCGGVDKEEHFIEVRMDGKVEEFHERCRDRMLCMMSLKAMRLVK